MHLLKNRLAGCEFLLPISGLFIDAHQLAEKTDFFWTGRLLVGKQRLIEFGGSLVAFSLEQSIGQLPRHGDGQPVLFAVLVLVPLHELFQDGDRAIVFARRLIELGERAGGVARIQVAVSVPCLIAGEALLAEFDGVLRFYPQGRASVDKAAAFVVQLDNIVIAVGELLFVFAFKLLKELLRRSFSRRGGGDRGLSQRRRRGERKGGEDGSQETSASGTHGAISVEGNESG